MVAHAQRILTVTHDEPDDEAAARPRRPRLRFGLALVGTVVAAELLARVLGPFLPPPNAGLPAELDRQLERIEARREPIDTFIVGASELAVGVDPAALADGSDAVGAAHTVWLAGIGADTIGALALDVVLEREEPARLIVGLTSREANGADRFRAGRDGALLGSPAYRAMSGELGALDRLERAASQVSALVRDRDRLRRPLEIARHVVRNGTAEVPMLEIDEYGMHTDRLDIDRYAESPAHLEQERQAMAGYRLDVDALAELEVVLAAAQADGVEVVLVQLPVYERHYLALQPGLTERDAAFVTATEQLAERAGIRYLDARGELDWDDPTLWADVNHLNGNGTARLTDWLVDRLDAA
ncbi:MAG: hypothetical protein AB7W59_14810 [Acidimicrobiia bacterium]